MPPRNGALALRCELVVLLLTVGWAKASVGLAGGPTGVLVRFDKLQRPTISPTEAERIRLGPGERALIVWTEPQGDMRAVFQGHWQRPAGPDPQRLSAVPVRGHASSDPLSVRATSQLTTQLDPLFLPSVVKSLSGDRRGRLLTPVDGSAVLFDRPTFRRFRDGGDQLPPESMMLAGNGRSAPIDFAERQVNVPFESLSGLPAAWQAGLPAGEYTLKTQTSGEVVCRFRVEESVVRKSFLTMLQPWARLLGGHEDPLYTLVLVESLITNQPQPYLADALDQIDGLPAEQRTPHLTWRRDAIIALLQAQPEPLPVELQQDATGIAVIDKSRWLISRGHWRDALAQLDSIDAQADRRTIGLADLYRGVIHAEWGLSQEEAAEFYFRKALVGLEKSAAEDRFRALNDYANFLLNRTQDRMLDHAFQMAAGVRGLFVEALRSWDESRRFYEAAAEVADTLGPDQQASIQMNLARLHAIFADVLITLDDPNPDARRLTAAGQAALDRAQKHVERATDLAAQGDAIPAAAATLRAQLALRDGDLAACRQHATAARKLYLRLGSLTGVECIERLMGFLELRDQAAGQTRRAAVTHFESAQLLAELLRRRLPAESLGRTAVGFFSRRSYVNEQLVELFAGAGHNVDALRCAELAKARALQDLLVLNSPSSWMSKPFQLEELLSDWPADTVALEYFLTRNHAWLFVIDNQGQVEAMPLRDRAGQLVASRQLITQVQSILRNEFNQYGARLRQRVLQARGFDHQWQQGLHELYLTLLPAAARKQLGQCQILLIIPHHILHYFPFVALVSQTDRQQRGPLEMVKPRFLVDESYDVTYAPSLATWQLLRSRESRPLTQVAAAVVPQLPGAAPLPGVARELDALAQSFPGRVGEVARAEQATRGNTLRLLQQPGMLLIGAHGQNYPDEPLASELLLYPTGTDNGRLTAAELYRQRVRADLVTLSACYTGLADRSPLPGDDLFGLSRALLQVGARTVVTGYWDIFDGTGPDLMRLFFRHLAEGQTAPAALANAQREFLVPLRESGDPEPYLHPYFWAVYAISGDDHICFAPLSHSPTTAP